MKTKTIIPFTFLANQGKHLLLGVFILTFAISCQEKDKETGPQTSFTLQQVVDAMGGIDAIKAVKTVSYAVEGAAYEYDQDLPNEPIVLGSEYWYQYTSELNARKIRMDWSKIHIYQPTNYENGRSLMIINDKQGSISGEWKWSGYYIGLTAPTGVPAAKIESLLKNKLMANPIEMVQRLLTTYKMTDKAVDFTFSLPTRIVGLDIKVIIDPKTAKIIGAKTKESDYLHGDSWFQVDFLEMTKVGAIEMPSTVWFNLNGNTLQKEKYTNIQVNPTLTSDSYQLQSVAVPIAYDENQADLGVYLSQFYHRWTAWGLPIDFRQDNGSLVMDEYNLNYPPLPLGSQLIGPNVKIIGRPDNRLWTVAIQTPAGVYIVDSPFNAILTRNYITTIQRAFPGKSILGVISTHTHHDHFGGFREMVSQTENVYIGPKSVDFAKDVLKAPFTVLPDNYAKTPKTAQFHLINDITKIDGGAIEIHNLKPTRTTAIQHADENLIVYVPEYKCIIQSDQIWTGDFITIWNEQHTGKHYTELAKATLANNAKYLLDYIREKNLDVEIVVGTHGGRGTIQELEMLANYKK